MWRLLALRPAERHSPYRWFCRPLLRLPLASTRITAVTVGLMAEAADRLRGVLTERGYSLSEVNLAPFILSGGGAYCMTLRLDRQASPPKAPRPHIARSAAVEGGFQTRPYKNAAHLPAAKVCGR